MKKTYLALLMTVLAIGIFTTDVKASDFEETPEPLSGGVYEA